MHQKSLSSVRQIDVSPIKAQTKQKESKSTEKHNPWEQNKSKWHFSYCYKSKGKALVIAAANLKEISRGKENNQRLKREDRHWKKDYLLGRKISQDSSKTKASSSSSFIQLSRKSSSSLNHSFLEGKSSRKGNEDRSMSPLRKVEKMYFSKPSKSPFSRKNSASIKGSCFTSIKASPRAGKDYDSSFLSKAFKSNLHSRDHSLSHFQPSSEVSQAMFNQNYNSVLEEQEEQNNFLWTFQGNKKNENASAAEHLSHDASEKVSSSIGISKPYPDPKLPTAQAKSFLSQRARNINLLEYKPKMQDSTQCKDRVINEENAERENRSHSKDNYSQNFATKTSSIEKEIQVYKPKEQEFILTNEHELNIGSKINNSREKSKQNFTEIRNTRKFVRENESQSKVPNKKNNSKEKLKKVEVAIQTESEGSKSRHSSKPRKKTPHRIIDLSEFESRSSRATTSKRASNRHNTENSEIFKDYSSISSLKSLGLNKLSDASQIEFQPTSVTEKSYLSMGREECSRKNSLEFHNGKYEYSEIKVKYMEDYKEILLNKLLKEDVPIKQLSDLHRQVMEIAK